MSRGFSVPKTGPVVLPQDLGKEVAVRRAVDLEVLPELGTADLHLVVDDWAGTGNWASRVGGFTATLTGALTKQTTSRWKSRSEIIGFSTSNAFSLAADAAHTYDGVTPLTYEMVVRWSDSNTRLLGFTSATQGHVISATHPASISLSASITNNAGGNYQNASGTPSGTVQTNSARFMLLTVVFDPVTPIIRYCANGVSVLSNSGAVSGTLNTTPHGLGIGALWNGTVFTLPWGTSIVEILRHREAFSTTTILARAAPFNLVRGY